MNMRSIAFFTLVLLSLCAFGLGCSSSNAVTPSDQISTWNGEKYETWFGGTFALNPQTGQSEIANDRNSDFYYHVTGLIKNYLKIHVLEIIGTTWKIEVEITNPTAIQVHDVRVVFLDTYGKTVLNPDGFTNLYDPADKNPYIAFAKEYPNRAFPVGPGAKDTEILLLDWPSGQPSYVSYRVGVSLGGNCGDPYLINNPKQTGELYPSGGSSTISVDVFDWQNNISWVKVDTTPLTGGLTNLAHAGGNTYSATISNTKSAPVGTYKCLVAASSPNSDNLIAYSYMNIAVVVDQPPVVTYDEAVSVGTIGHTEDYGKVIALTDLINFTQGPWNFSAQWYEGIYRREVISPNATEFANFKSKYTEATSVLKIPKPSDVSFDYYPRYYSSPKRYDLGFENSIQGVAKGFHYDTAVAVPYPINVGYSYNASATGYTTVIVSTKFTLTWDVDYIAWGRVTTHVETQKALLIRTIKRVQIGALIDQYEVIYDWVGDDGHILATFWTSDFDQATGLPYPGSILDGYLLDSHSP